MLLFLLFCWGGESHDALMQERKYFSAAQALQEQAHALEDPKVLREYVTLVTEYYSSQVAFRTFFLKDLRKGERLAELRRNTEKITLNTNGTIVERNLEALLGQAIQKFPNDLDVRFAVGTYLFRGRCCQTKPKLKGEPRKILETFRQADAAGVRSPGSMLALTLDSLSKKDDAKAREYVQKGLALKDNDPELVLAHMDDLLHTKQWEAGIIQARKLFEIAYDADLKVNALLGAARGLYAQKKFRESSDTALGALKISPGNGFALQMGLDGLRTAQLSQQYQDTVLNFLSKQPDNPAIFQVYMQYLRVRGVKEEDRQLMKAYVEQREEAPLVRVTRLVNSASFLRLEKQTPKALAYVKQARTLAGEIENPPADLIPFLDDLLKTAEQHQ